MKLKNVLIVVKDTERARRFYREIFGLETVLNREGNVILTEGLVLQEERLWREALGEEEILHSPCFALYFEERDLEGFKERLLSLYPDIRLVTPLTTTGEGRRLFRILDLDGNLIEVREEARKHTHLKKLSRPR